MMDQPQPLIVHLTELRERLIRCLFLFILAFGIAYYYSQPLFDFLVQPLADVLQAKGEQRRLIYTSLTEAFTTYLRVALFFASFVTFPFAAFQVWKFVVPGLYAHERFVFRYFLISIPFFFLTGAIFAYYIIFPTAYTFFLNFESIGTVNGMPIQLEAKLNEYLSFVMRLIFAFGISFEMPVILSILAYANIVQSHMLKRYWRIAVVGIFTLSAVITPPDLFSMLGLAIPLLLLYGLSMGMVRLIESRKQVLSPS